MKPVEVPPTGGGHVLLYRAVLEAAVSDGQAIMETLTQATRRALREREPMARTIRERQGLIEARQSLNKHEAVMIERYPSALRAAFALGGGSRTQAKALGSVQFDHLELMDEGQIVERVEFARAQQVVVLAVEHSLAEFNPVMCAAAGLSIVRADQNPVRPELYVQALQAVMNPLQLPVSVREHLMWHMSEALGVSLAALYKRLTLQLKGQGVQAAGFALRSTAGGPATPASYRLDEAPDASAPPVYLSPQTLLPAQPDTARHAPANPRGVTRRTPAPHDESLLTLNKLRQLLAGELESTVNSPAPGSFADQFSREFEGGGDRREPAQPDFDATVPAAFEALQEMRQVEHVMARIGTRQGGQANAPERANSSLGALRAALRGSAQGLGQSLSLEVVTLMVDNIASDARLLAPVQQVIRSLEPAFLRLALVDPRFFSDKQHPARRLLQEITQRSLAFDTVEARGFERFLKPLQQLAGPLAERQIEGAQPFEQVLRVLAHAWGEPRPAGQIASAVQALQHAEERNLLAESVAREIAARPDVQKIAPGVVDFLCGPWAQVVAHAQLANTTGADDPGQFRELVLALVWSAQPELTRSKISKLTRLVPKLLSKLREGLALIDYPPLKTSVFFELLMNLHQQAFRVPVTPATPLPERATPALPILLDPWIAPAEAKASGFMEAPLGLVQSAASSLAVMDKAAAAPDSLALPVGAWIELWVNGSWTRAQLTWASPHGTLFLFTSAAGSTQSMTLRSRDKLLLAGTMRVISGQALVDGALDAVVQTAMDNSVDIRL